MTSEENRLKQKLADTEKQIKDLKDERRRTALAGQRDPAIEKIRGQQQRDIDDLICQSNDMYDALAQLSEELSSSERKAAEKARQRKIKQAQKLAKEIFKLGDQIAGGIKQAADGHEAFQEKKSELATLLRQAGLGGTANAISRELKGQTLKHILVATSPRVARLLGVPPFANGGRRKSYGLIDAIRRAEPARWTDQPSDDLAFKAQTKGG